MEKGENDEGLIGRGELLYDRFSTGEEEEEDDDDEDSLNDENYDGEAKEGIFRSTYPSRGSARAKEDDDAEILDDDDDDCDSWGETSAYEPLPVEDDDAEESDRFRRDEELLQKEQLVQEKKEKVNHTARVEEVKRIRGENGVLSRPGQHASSFVQQDPAAGARAVRMVKEILEEYLELKDRTANIVEAAKILADTGRRPLLDLLAKAVISDMVPAEHIAWDEFGDAFENM
jgi:hypothetical protein